MLLLNFYRAYFALTSGALVYFLLYRSLWLAVGIAVVTRTGWFFIEKAMHTVFISRWFEENQAAFKEQFGPYGIRLINRAETDAAVKNSLAEVFTPDLKKLKQTVDSLDAMDVIFKAGMRPDGDTWQLHDLKLKYGKWRLEKHATR